MALNGKVALVTGASRGIGRGIALQLGEAGATVYVTGRQPHMSQKMDQFTLPTLEKTAQEVTDRGGKGIAVYVDHSNMSEVEELFKQIEQETNGQLDILVNNAFSAIQQLADFSGRKFWEVEPEFWDQVNNVGLRNHYYCSWYAARMMVKRRTGLIVNISSVGGLMYFFAVPYGVGKAANDRMAADMAIELREYGVTVVSLWPGAVKTELFGTYAESGKFKGSIDKTTREVEQMVKEGETPEFTGKAIVALASDPNLLKKTGRIWTTADLGIDYGFRDIDGRQPDSMRGMKLVLGQVMGIEAVSTYGASFGLELNAAKRKVLLSVVTPRPIHPIKIGTEKIEVVESFCYLGSIITSSGSCSDDVAHRIGKACGAFNLLNRCLWTMPVRNSVKFRVYRAAIVPVMTYASSTWSLTKADRDKLDAAERKFCRRILGYTWRGRKRNDELYKGAKPFTGARGVPRLSERIRRDRLKLLGHILRRDEQRLTKTVLLSQPAPTWKAKRGRPRSNWLTAVKDDLRASGFDEAVKNARERRGREINTRWHSAKWLQAVEVMSQNKSEWKRICSYGDGFRMALNGKVALVTGASRGIGRGIALQLGEAGATVYVTGRQPHMSQKMDQITLPTLEKTAQEVTDRGGKGIAVYVDHSNMSKVEELFKQIEQETNGQLDILVNNAFSAVQQLADLNGRKFWEVEPELWDQVNNVGLRNHYYCSWYAARMMVKRRTGLIVNISSVGGLIYFFAVPYCVGKTANDRMAADMAIELREYGVTVVSLWPGAVKTEMLCSYAESGKFKESIDKTTRELEQMVKEGETPEFTGKAIVALASDPNLLKKTGRIWTSADLGIDYGFRDIDGRQPDSMRGMKRILGQVGLANIGAYFPVWFRMPGWLMTAVMSRL